MKEIRRASLDWRTVLPFILPSCPHCDQRPDQLGLWSKRKIRSLTVHKRERKRLMMIDGRHLRWDEMKCVIIINYTSCGRNKKRSGSRRADGRTDDYDSSLASSTCITFWNDCKANLSEKKRVRQCLFTLSFSLWQSNKCKLNYLVCWFAEHQSTWVWLLSRIGDSPHRPSKSPRDLKCQTLFLCAAVEAWSVDRFANTSLSLALGFSMNN